MQYDVLEMPGRGGLGSNIRYTQPQYNNPQPLHSQSTVLREETDEETGDTILRRIPQSTYPQPDSHYVMFRADNEDVWRIYAGPFDLGTAAEIASALQAYSK